MYKILSYHFYNRYIKFIDSRPEREYKSNIGYERHHILPKKIYPQLEKLKSNIVVLTAREHYLCHWMLAKIYGGTMWFAFNQMKRVIQGDVKKSALYSLSKKYIAEVQSKAATGRKMTSENKYRMSKRMSGMVWVKNKNDYLDYKLMPVSDKLYISGEYVQIHTGRKNSIESLKNLKDNNRIKGKIPYFNEKSGIVKYFKKDADIPVDFVPGRDPKSNTKNSNSNKDLRYINNPLTQEQTRLKYNSKLPDGWEFGRINGHQTGLSIMNDPNKITIFNLETGIVSKITRDLYKINFNTISTPLNGYLVIIDDYIFENIKCFNSLLPNFLELSLKTLNKEIKLHFNQTKERQDFALQFLGMTYSSLGFGIIPLKQYNISMFKHKKIVRLIDDKFDKFQFIRTLEEKRKTFNGNICIK